MNYYDYEDYYEPSEFDAMVEEFKDSLRKSVKEEVQNEIERLKKENEKLREVKENFKAIEREYKNKCNELSREIEKCKNDAAKMRLEQLFEHCGMNMTLYYPSSMWVYKPKCDKCEEDGYITYTTPMGRKAREKCLCSEPRNKYVPAPYYCTEFRVNRVNRDIKYPLLMWYRKYRDYNSDCEGYTYDTTDLLRFIYTGEDFETIYEEYKSRVYFRNEEDCKKYCDWMNKRNGITEDMTARL